MSGTKKRNTGADKEMVVPTPNTNKEESASEEVKTPTESTPAELPTQAVDVAVPDEVKEAGEATDGGEGSPAEEISGEQEKAPVVVEEMTFKAPKDQVRRKNFTPKRGAFGMWEVELEGGGQVPKMLGGSFTSEVEANTMIAKYLRG